MTPAETVESSLDELGVAHARRAGGEWLFVLSGERKKAMPVVLTLRDRSLAIEAFFLRRPMDNLGDVYRMMLARNMRPGPVRLAVDASGDVYIVGEAELDSAAVDRLLGAALATADELFDAAVAVGFASYLERERAWRERAAQEPDSSD